MLQLEQQLIQVLIILEVTSVVTVEGVGTFRPYRGQSIFFNEKYFSVQGVTITNPGSGYSTAPLVSLNQQDQEMQLLLS